MTSLRTTLNRMAIGAILLAGLGASSAFGQTFATTGTTTLNVTVAPEAALAINTASTALTTPGVGLFADYTGTTSFTYKIRTAQTSGAGHIALQITSDFSGSGGPSVGAPPTTGDALKIACTSAKGTVCASATPALVSNPTTVVSFGPDVHSAKDGDAGSVTWTLTNDPAYKTGDYTATATFTISVP